MSIDVGRALREGADDLTSARGALLYVLFALSALVSLPVYQTLNRMMTDYVIGLAAAQQIAESLDTTVEELFGVATPLAVDVGVPILAGGLLVAFVVSEAVHFVAIRAFASDSDATLPTEDITSNVGRKLVVLLIASFVVQVLVFVGLGVFVLPGLIAAVLVVFVRQAVVLSDAGIIGSVRKSGSLVLDNPFQVLAILVALLVVGFVVGIPTMFVPLGTVPFSVLSALLGAVGTVYGVAVVTEAYRQVEDGETATGPPGPDDLDREFTDEGV